MQIWFQFRSEINLMMSCLFHKMLFDSSSAKIIKYFINSIRLENFLSLTYLVQKYLKFQEKSFSNDYNLFGFGEKCFSHIYFTRTFFRLSFTFWPRKFIFRNSNFFFQIENWGHLFVYLCVSLEQLMLYANFQQFPMDIRTH